MPRRPEWDPKPPESLWTGTLGEGRILQSSSLSPLCPRAMPLTQCSGAGAVSPHYSTRRGLGGQVRLTGWASKAPNYPPSSGKSTFRHPGWGRGPPSGALGIKGGEHGRRNLDPQPQPDQLPAMASPAPLNRVPQPHVATGRLNLAESESRCARSIRYTADFKDRVQKKDIKFKLRRPPVDLLEHSHARLLRVVHGGSRAATADLKWLQTGLCGSESRKHLQSGSLQQGFASPRYGQTAGVKKRDGESRSGSCRGTKKRTRT